jgi:hypothetical protein
MPPHLTGTVSCEITIKGHQFSNGADATLTGTVSPDCQSLCFAGSMILNRK